LWDFSIGSFACREFGIATIGGLLRRQMVSLCDHLIKIRSDVTMHIQLAHLALEHIFG